MGQIVRPPGRALGKCLSHATMDSHFGAQNFFSFAFASFFLRFGRGVSTKPLYQRVKKTIRPITAASRPIAMIASRGLGGSIGA